MKTLLDLRGEGGGVQGYYCVNIKISLCSYLGQITLDCKTVIHALCVEFFSAIQGLIALTIAC